MMVTRDGQTRCCCCCEAEEEEEEEEDSRQNWRMLKRML